MTLLECWLSLYSVGYFWFIFRLIFPLLSTRCMERLRCLCFPLSSLQSFSLFPFSPSQSKCLHTSMAAELTSRSDRLIVSYPVGVSVLGYVPNGTLFPI